MTSTGFIVGTIVAIVFFLIGLGLLAGSAMFAEDPFDRHFFYGFGVLTVLVTAGVWLGTTWPSFDMRYHSYRPVSGQVTQVGDRLLSQDKGTTQEIVVIIGGQDYRCDDTRCSLVKVGDQLRMNCIREYVWNGGADGYTCNFVSDQH